MIIYNDDPDASELRVQLNGSSVFPNMILSTNTFNFGEYSGNFQASSLDGNYWDLTLATGRTEDDIQLSLDIMGTLPEGYEIKILNLDLRYPLPIPVEGQDLFTQKVFKSESQYQLRVLVGNKSFIGDNDLGIGLAPTEYQLAQNYPNPFNGATQIHFDIPEPSALSVVIYDLTGRQIRTLVGSDAHPVGAYALSWDGNDDQGHHLASGIYLVSLQAPHFRATRKMVLLK